MHLNVYEKNSERVPRREEPLDVLALCVVIFIMLMLFLLIWRLYKFALKFDESQGYRTHCRDRQGNIFTISAEGEANRNYGEFYVIEPNSDDTRVRAQVEKDDKDLPTYEEVMAATLAASAAACGVVVGAGSTTSLGVASANGEARDTTITINAPSSTNIPIDVPPYSEVDPNPVPSISNINFNESSVLTDCNSASATSRTQTDLTVSLPMGTESITTTSSSNSTASSPHMTLTAIHNEPSTSQNIVVPLPAVINSQDSSAA